MKKNQQAFEGYQKQAVETILRKPISVEAFQQARARADKIPANSMQQRIELIAREVR
jgi:hypothetical protein